MGLTCLMWEGLVSSCVSCVVHRSVLVTHCDEPSSLISSPPRSTPFCPRKSPLFLIRNFLVTGFSPLRKSPLCFLTLPLSSVLFAFVVHSVCFLSALCGTIHELSVGAPRGRRGAHLCGADRHTCTGVDFTLQRTTAHIKTPEGGWGWEARVQCPVLPFQETADFSITLLFLVLSPFCHSICHKSGPAEAQGCGGMREHWEMQCLFSLWQAEQKTRSDVAVAPSSICPQLRLRADSTHMQHPLSLPPSSVAPPRWRGGMTAGADEWARGERKGVGVRRWRRGERSGGEKEEEVAARAGTHDGAHKR